MARVDEWLRNKVSEKVSHCLIFGSAWTAWVMSVISLGSYNWIAENVNSINGPYTYGLFMERDTCSLCQPVQNVPPFMDATRAFMIMGNLCGISVCILDVVLVIKRINIPEAVIRPLKIGCFSLSCCANICTLIGVSVFQANGIQLIENNGVDGTLLQPYGYGLVLAWCSWVLYTCSIPFAFIEISPTRSRRVDVFDAAPAKKMGTAQNPSATPQQSATAATDESDSFVAETAS